MHRKLTRHLAEAADSGVDQFAAWNERTDLALQLAEAHAAGLTMAATLDACAALPPDLAAAGHDLRLMVFLEEISANASWYLTEGLVTAHVVRTLPDQLTAVCARLLPYAQRLTDMLNVPTTIIRSAIVDADYATKLAPALGDGGTKLLRHVWSAS